MNNSRSHYAIFFWIGITVILVLNLLLWVFVNQVEYKFSSELKTRLISSNRAIAREVDEEQITLLIPDQRNTLEYLFLQQMLEGIRREDNLQSILILSFDGKILVSSPEILAEQKNIIQAENQYFRKAQNGQYAATEAEQIAGEWFLSSYGPITNVDGTIVAIQIIEAKATYFETLKNLRNSLMLYSAITIFIIAVIAIFLFRMIKQTLLYQETIKDHEHLVQLGTMAANVAHEIRNPLGIIEGSNELIKKKYGQTDDELFSYIPSETKRLAGIIEDFLTFSRTPKVQTSEFYLSDILDRINVWKTMENPGSISTENCDGKIQIISDPNLLEQALLNIIKNGLEASAAGNINIYASNQKNKIEIGVEDDGPGIAPETLDKIFQPFFTTKEKGTGLGLAITNRIIKLLQGEIRVDSIPGKKTIVKIILPKRLK